MPADPAMYENLRGASGQRLCLTYESVRLARGKARRITGGVPLVNASLMGHRCVFGRVVWMVVLAT